MAVMASAESPAPDKYLPPIVTVGRATKPPVVDGVVSPGEWDETAAVTGFISVSDKTMANRQAVVNVAFDDTTLYFLFRSPVERGIPLKALARERDGRVIEDDAVIIFLNVPGTGVTPNTLYHFVGNSRGVVWDRTRNAGPDWNGDWKFANGVTNGVWIAEISITFAELGTKTPAAGETWRMNLCRNWNSPALLSAWPLTAQLSDIDKMGFLRFSAKTPLVAVEDFGPFAGNRVKFASAVFVPPGSEKTDVKITLAAQNEGITTAEKITETNMASASAGKFNLELPLTGKVDVLNFTVAAGSETIYRSIIPFMPGDLLELNLMPLPSRDICRVFWQIRDLQLRRQAQELSIKLITEGALEPVASRSISELAPGSGSCELEIGKLAAGQYRINAELLDKGQVIAKTFAVLSMPDEPWRNTKVGVTDQVPSPWTPVRVETGAKDNSDIKVSVWGRDYAFTKTPFPSRILTRGEEILAGPVRWQALVGGSPVAWKHVSSTLETNTPAKISFRVLQESERFSLETRTSIEYDGLVWCDVNFIPKNGQKQLDNLELVIPLKAANSRYRFLPAEFASSGLNEIKAGAEYRRARPRKDFVWLGDEERGLCWFSTNPNQYNNSDKKNAFSISRSADTINVAIRFIDHPLLITEPLKVGFGFMATPNRPLPSGWRRWGTQRWLGVNWTIPWTDEAWTAYGGGYPESNNPEFYRVMMESLHRRNIKAVPYVLMRWRDTNSSEWRYNRFDWEIPGGVSSYSEKRKFWHGNSVCPESDSYRDFLCYMAKKFVEDYNLDGLYHDIQDPILCSNENHGCGEGRWNIMGSRELNRRIYAIIHAFPRPMIKLDHLSGYWCDPFAVFCDGVVIGEEMCADGMQAKDVIGTYRVWDDYFKINGIRDYLVAAGAVTGQRGPLPWFLPENQGNSQEATRGLLALLLPMDSAWTIWNGRNDFHEMHKLWRTVESFGLGQDDVVFTGYWSRELPVNARFVMQDSSAMPTEKPVISTWSRGQNGTLLAIANLSTNNDYLAEVELDLNKLGLKGAVEIADAEAPIKWYPSAGKFKISVRMKDFRFVWIRPADRQSAEIPLIEETVEQQLAGYLPESVRKGQGDLEVGKVAGNALTRVGQAIILKKPIKLTFLEANFSFGGKLMDRYNPIVKEGDLCNENVREPQVKIVEIGADGLPIEDKVMVPNDWVTFSEFRPGEDLQPRMFYFDRIVELPVGSYAVIFSKEPEKPGASLTYSLAGYPQSLMPESYGLFYDGQKWEKRDKIVACGLFGPVIR